MVEKKIWKNTRLLYVYYVLVILNIDLALVLYFFNNVTKMERSILKDMTFYTSLPLAAIYLWTVEVNFLSTKWTSRTCPIQIVFLFLFYRKFKISNWRATTTTFSFKILFSKYLEHVYYVTLIQCIRGVFVFVIPGKSIPAQSWR